MKKPTKAELDKIDLSVLNEYLLSARIQEGYFSRPAGVEHYRLLAWLSKQFKDTVITEIGTLDGMGLIALSFNQRNKVVSWDVRDYKWKNHVPPNGERKIIEREENGELNTSYMSEVLKSPVIFYDAQHEGKEEREFFNDLIDMGWKGILILDDIHLNKEMKEFWASISIRKEDWSDVGHACGTGIVYFD